MVQRNMENWQCQDAVPEVGMLAWPLFGNPEFRDARDIGCRWERGRGSRRSLIARYGRSLYAERVDFTRTRS